MLSLLRMRLLQALSIQNRSTGGIATTDINSKLDRAGASQPAQALSIKRVGNATPIFYMCAIAHRLATETQPAATIAAQLAATLQQGDPGDLDGLPQGVMVQATSAGFIQFEIGDRAIAAWLDQLITAPPQSFLVEPLSEGERQVMVQSSAVFEVQYAHARCCSLLQLAQREGIITLDGLQESPLHWRFANHPTLPWLTSAAQLCLNHPVDRTLIGHLFEALDQLSTPSPRRTQSALLQTAQAVAQAFQSFHRAHQLGTTGVEPALRLARLGLLMATQRILYLLLLEGLHLCPVVAL